MTSTFADMIDSDSTSNHVEKPTQATIKKDVAVASTYEVKTSMKSLQEICSGQSVTLREKDSGNISFLKDSRLPEALYKHVASYIRTFPSGRGYMIRFVQKKNVPAFKQILTKSGINVTYVGEVAK